MEAAKEAAVEEDNMDGEGALDGVKTEAVVEGEEETMATMLI